MRGRRPDPSPSQRSGGVPLPALVRTRALSVEQCRSVAVAVALDVAGAHARGDVVGPLHPCRVLVDPGGRPLLTPRPADDVPWTQEDDVVGVRRLVRWLVGEQPPAVPVGELARLLVRGGGVAALPEVRQPAPCARRRRWWGRAR